MTFKKLKPSLLVACLRVVFCMTSKYFRFSLWCGDLTSIWAVILLFKVSGLVSIRHYPLNSPMVLLFFLMICLCLVRLKAHFEVNPRDLGNEILYLDIYIIYFSNSCPTVWGSKFQLICWADLLKHDKVLSKNPPAPHLRDVPDYLLDPKTQEARKFVKLARAAMGNTKSARHGGSKKKFKKSGDPLKTFSTEVLLNFFTLFQRWYLAYANFHTSDVGVLSKKSRIRYGN